MRRRMNTIKRVLKEVRADVGDGARPRSGRTRRQHARRSSPSWGGVQAILAHRVAHALHGRRRHGGAAGDRLRDPRSDRDRDPSRRQDRRRLLHRSRLRRRDRRDGRDRRPGDDLPGRHARRHRLSARQAPSDRRGQRHDRLGREAARPDHDRPRLEGRREHGRRHRRPGETRPSSATPATSSASRAASPEGPDTDWIHLPDPVADAIKALSERLARDRAPARPLDGEQPEAEVRRVATEAAARRPPAVEARPERLRGELSSVADGSADL